MQCITKTDNTNPKSQELAYQKGDLVTIISTCQVIYNFHHTHYNNYLTLMLCIHDRTFDGLNHVGLFDGLSTDFRRIRLVYTQSHQSPMDLIVMTYD
ncbi:hypothetical protein AB205_0217120 [Aquarana catesbeiana]|uniref:SH3 domain-containing protein n=1 Tax=Aquarana catesbeiana TaxID=8400 RepID=A0A2G9RS90_AQUCT|nr:hypothetical protein AB205_0217120 [Aquarana catesbeiana]